MKEKDNKKKKLFLGCYNKSVILTYLGVSISLLGMINIEHRGISVICLVTAGICDLFDGVVARKSKRTDTERAFGVQIDSLADMISFIAFPRIKIRDISWKNLDFWLPLITRKIWQHSACIPMATASWS